MSSQVSKDVSFMSKRMELIGVWNTIMDWLDDLMRFAKKLLESAGLPLNYKKMSLHAVMAWAHTTFPGVEAPRLSSNCMH